ncbi:Class II abasic (AP) endonuclease [Podila minutissima]|uniref:DNA-(apurinic or apyrimidinic site) endonuclease 2 n=1 Tax=Podila minutissima TaxID=64525 RepID=A0A9P5SL64_9FUNG|nr:Class II abasic (AP) endonuclease [Podila minutissima]
MKFMTWNVNGIRALTQYHPYCDDLHKNYREILDYLGADIICLQETKITRSKLESDLALVPGYNSYWSFHRTKSGYSGVAVYVKDHIKLLAAEEGISGVLSGNLSSPMSTPGSNPGSQPDSDFNEKTPKVGGYPAMETQDPAVYIRLQELDNEGRGIVLDFGFFVLFNLYCPNETDDTRLPFKMDYYNLLEARVRELIKEGRQVMVLGDMNVIPSELDHCDPAKWKKESGESDFTNTPPHFILVTEGLLPWFKSCDRLPHIVGSDHCPVIAEMFPELKIEYPGGEAQPGTAPSGQSLQEVLDSYGGSTDHALAAKFYDEFSGKQQKLSLFFKKSAKELTPPLIKGTSADQKRPTTDTGNEEPRKKPFFSADKILDTPAPSTFTTSSQTMSSNNTPPPPAAPAPHTPATIVPSKPIVKMFSKTTAARTAQGKVGGKKSVSKPSGQQSVLSFFSTPGANKKAAPESSTSDFTTNSQTTSSQPMLSQSSDVSSSQPLSIETFDEGATTSASHFSPNNFADWIPGSQDVLPFTSNEESITSKWQSLFTPRVVPKCKFHQEDCTEYTVNKKGPNKGRRFFLCSRPVGPEGDSIGQKPEYRCNHFQWLNPPGNGAKKII